LDAENFKCTISAAAKAISGMKRKTLFIAIIFYLTLLAVFLMVNGLTASGYGLNFKIFKDSTTIAEGISGNIELENLNDLPEEYFDAKWTGFFYAPTTRLYEIQAAADDSLQLQIDKNIVLLRDAKHGHHLVTHFVPLQRGFHRIEADYSQFTGSRLLILMIDDPMSLPNWISVPPFFPTIPSRAALWKSGLITFFRNLIFIWLTGIIALAVIATSRLYSHKPFFQSKNSFVRIVRVVIPAVIILYAALLRFEALTIKHGVVSSPAIVRILQTQIGFVRYLHPDTLRWRAGSNPYERGDPINYIRMARAMKSFYAPQFREPFYVFVVKQFLRVFDQKNIAVSFASGTFSVFAVFVTFLLAKYAFSWWVGVLASFGMAIDSELISIGVDGWRDDTFMSLVLLFAYALLRLFRKASFGNALFAGIVAGLVCLTRLTSFSFIVPGYFFVLIAGKEPAISQRLRSVTLSAFIFGIVIAPFLINCAIEFGDPLFSVNDNTKFYRMRENLPSEEPKSVARYLSEKLIDRPFKFIDIGLVGITRYPFLNKWKGFNYLSPVLVKFLSGCALVGTILLLFSTQGRLILIVLISSLIPYAFTYEIAGGFEWRFTMHAYPFYMIAGALFLILVGGALFTKNTWGYFSDQSLSKRSLLITSSLVLFILIGGWFLLNQSYFQRIKEAIMNEEPILVASGDRDFEFFDEGWYQAVQMSEATVRITKETASVLSVPLKSAKEYRLILRINPVFEKPEKPSNYSVSVNNRVAGEIEVNEKVHSAYVLELPQGFAKDGVNEIRFQRLDPKSPEVALHYLKLQPIGAFQWAMEKYENNEFNEAIPLFEQAMQRSEKRYGPVFYLGLCYLRLDQPAKAIEYFNKALTLSRRNPQILEARAEAYLKTKQYDSALDDLKRVLKIQPNNQNAQRLFELATKKQ
jgi:hypothetical protein